MAKNKKTIEITNPETGEIEQLDPTRLVEGLRNYLLDVHKQAGMKKAWQDMKEAEQSKIIDSCTTEAAHLVSNCVEMVATGKYSVVHARLDNFKVKDGETIITAKGRAEDEILVALNHGTKHTVKIVIVDKSQFDESRSNLEPDPDEPELPMDGEEEAEPEAFEEVDESYGANAYDAGVAAYKNGQEIDDCPYDQETEDREIWTEGFEYAKAQAEDDAS